MQNFQRAPLALIVVMAAAMLNLSSLTLRGQLGTAESAQYDTRPLPGTWYSLQNPEWPPLPANLFDLPFYSLSNSVFVIDDRSVDYNALQKEAAAKAEAEGTLGEKGGANGPMSASYSSNDLWLEITAVTNDLAFLTLHNIATNLTYQLLSKLAVTDAYWNPGETNSSATNEIVFTPVPTEGQPTKFFWAAGSDTTVGVFRSTDAIEPTTGDPGQSGYFYFVRFGPTDADLTVYYRISGSAANGVDYGTIANSITILAGDSTAYREIDPVADSFLEFEEWVTLTLIVTNGYLVDPVNPRANITINDNFSTNLFTTVANVDGPVGIDYHQPTASLIVSSNYIPNTSSMGFVRIDTNGVVTNWSGVQNLFEEIKVATVKTTANGFTNGEMFFGTGQDGQIGWLSADGTVSNLNWITLTNETQETIFRGSLFVDQSGSFGGDLIAVTGKSQLEGGEVWRISSPTNATRLANITNSAFPHLEGLITLTNDLQKWGPWAAKIITGAEAKVPPLIHAIDTNGVVTSFDLGIAAENFDIIPDSQDLYCCDLGNNAILKLSRTLLTDYVGDLLVTDAGEFSGTVRLFIVHWDSTNSAFVTRSIPVPSVNFEHVTFAPINIPNL